MTTPVKLLIEMSDKQEKRLKATYVFDNEKTKTIYFGSPPAFTFFDGADAIKRANYIKRHKVNENWNDIYSAGFMARFVLWERRTTVRRILSQKTKLPLKNIVMRSIITNTKA